MPQTNEHFASSPGGGKAGLWGVGVGGVNLLSSLEWVWVSLPSQSPALRCAFCHRPPTPLEQLCQPWHGSIAHILPAGLGGGISALSSWGRLIGPTAALQGPNLQQGGGRGLYNKVCPPGSSSTQRQTRRCQGSPECPCRCLCVLGSVSCQRMDQAGHAGSKLQDQSRPGQMGMPPKGRSAPPHGLTPL